MTILTEEIYYADKALLEAIETDFDLIDDSAWFTLHQHKTDKTFWRLDKWDKYQKQVLVRLNTAENWTVYDDKELRIGLLLRSRNTTNEKCVWKDCNRAALTGLAYCERHAYEEIGIRK